MSVMHVDQKLEIREATEADFDAIWDIFREVVSSGDAFAFDEATSREEVRRLWLGEGAQAFVAVNEGEVVGTSYLKANQPGRGAHVANAGFMVPAGERKLGVGRALAEHALREAARLGYLAMQFNFVVSTNRAAVGLWQKLGFAVVGTLPKAFAHGQLGLVDVYVMHRFL